MASAIEGRCGWSGRHPKCELFWRLPRCTGHMAGQAAVGLCASQVSGLHSQCQRNSKTEMVRLMNKAVSIQLLCYSLLLAGLGLFAYNLAAEPARPAFYAAVVGGVLCAAWAVLAIAGKCFKILPILTLVAVSFVLLSQMVTMWADEARKGPDYHKASIAITVLFVLSIAMLIRVAYSGLNIAQGSIGAGGDAPPRSPTSPPSGPERKQRNA